MRHGEQKSLWILAKTGPVERLYLSPIGQPVGAHSLHIGDRLGFTGARRSLEQTGLSSESHLFPLNLLRFRQDFRLH